MSYGEIWKKLSKIDCSDHVETKGTGNYSLSYLSWAWAWGVLMEHYPDAQYDFLDENHLENGTVETTCKVTIGDCYRMMWLPVMDHKNNAIQDPTTRQISDTRMRCLVKCLAMFGLGFYIYAGEDLPQQDPYTEEEKDTLLSLIANKDAIGLRKFYGDVGQEKMDALFNCAPSGQKTRFKGEVRELYKQANDQIKASVAAIQEAIGLKSAEGVAEVYAELTEDETFFVNKALTEVEHKAIEEINAGVAA